MTTPTSSPVLVRAREGTALHWGPAGRIRILAGADSTGGAFSVVESTEEPGGGAPLHVHHGEAEAFYVLEGAIELTCGGEVVTAAAGDFVCAPKDVPHKYAVVGERPARVLLFFSRPGFEQFFAEGGTPVDRPPAGPPDPERMQQLLDRYDLELLEPFGGH